MELREFTIDMSKKNDYIGKIRYKSTKRKTPVIMIATDKDAPSDLIVRATMISTWGFDLVVHTEQNKLIKIRVMIK